MRRRGPFCGAPSELPVLLALSDPTPDWSGVAFDPELVRKNGLTRERLREIALGLQVMLDDDTLTDADLKGLLNRCAGRVWDFGLGMSARQFLDAVVRRLKELAGG